MKTKVYTHEDWSRDGTFSATPGQEITAEIYDEMLCVLPPAYWNGGIFQVGEPHSTDKETFKHLFATFKREGDKYYFLGHCLLGQTEHRESWKWGED